MVKMTFTLDDDTVDRLRRLATRLGRPQSQVVRESIKEYEERLRLLAVVDRISKAPPTRPQEEVNAELRMIRTARRRWARTSR